MGRSPAVLMVLVTAMVVSTVCHGCQSARPGGPPGPPAMLVKVAEVRAVAVGDTSTFVGTAKSRRSVTLRPQVAGLVGKIFAHYGDVVAEGTPLLELDPTKQQATLNSASAGVDSARAERDTAEQKLKSLKAARQSRISKLNFARQQRERYALLQTQGAVSQESVDQFQNGVEVAQAELESTDAEIQAQLATIAKADKIIRQSGAGVSEQKAQLGYFTIKAPFSGTVGDIPVRLGEYVTTDTALTTVNQNQPLEVDISIPARQSGKLKIGQTVEVLSTDNQPVGKAAVFFVSPQVSSDSQTVLIKALFANADGVLRSGQIVPVRLIWKNELRTVVPTTAVSHLSGQTFVFVAESQGKNDCVARQKAVQLGEIEGNSYVVISGIEPGEKVVVSGVQNLSDGVPIQPKS